MIFASVVLACACGDASRPGNSHAWPTKELDQTEVVLGYGWEHPVTAENFEPSATEKLGSAPNTIAGETLRNIVTDPNVRIRADGQACATCHAWAVNAERDSFCERVDDFLAQPTSTGASTDPPSAKPKILKSLFSAWRQAQCPD